VKAKLFWLPGLECSYGKIFIPVTKILVAKTEISVTGLARLLIWTHWHFYEEKSGEARSRKPSQPGWPGSYEEALSLEGFAPKDALGKRSFWHMLFLENEAQINKNNYATMLFMSKQVSLPKISSSLQEIKIDPKCYICPFCTKAFNYRSSTMKKTYHLLVEIHTLSKRGIWRKSGLVRESLCSVCVRSYEQEK